VKGLSHCEVLTQTCHSSYHTANCVGECYFQQWPMAFLVVEASATVYEVRKTRFEKEQGDRIGKNKAGCGEISYIVS
jgi:hypothetical protein